MANGLVEGRGGRSATRRNSQRNLLQPGDARGGSETNNFGRIAECEAGDDPFRRPAAISLRAGAALSREIPEISFVAGGFAKFCDRMQIISRRNDRKQERECAYQGHETER